jgi:alpha-L-fucosidase 2
MLLQSSVDEAGEATLELLPALPTAWADGQISGLRARGGYEVSMQWHNGQLVEATIKADKAGKATIAVNGKNKKLSFAKGQTEVFRP